MTITIKEMLECIDQQIKEGASRLVILSDYNDDCCKVQFGNTDDFYEIDVAINRRYDEIYTSLLEHYQNQIKLGNNNHHATSCTFLIIQDRVIVMMDYTSVTGRRWLYDINR